MRYKYMFTFSINSCYSNKDNKLFQLEYFLSSLGIIIYSSWNIK